MQLTVTVCDVCKNQNEPTKRYEVKEGDRRASVDLCEAHSQPFEGLMGVGTPRKKPGRPAGSQAPRKRAATKRAARVTTMDEIEKLKK